jgi:hypothetical protein
MMHEVVYAHILLTLGWMVPLRIRISFTILNPLRDECINHHQVHQTFETATFVVCSFVQTTKLPSKLFQHLTISNIDSDEVLYYVDGDFMSKIISSKLVTLLHPKGIPHGGTWSMERSIGHKKRTISGNGDVPPTNGNRRSNGIRRPDSIINLGRIVTIWLNYFPLRYNLLFASEA